MHLRIKWYRLQPECYRFGCRKWMQYSDKKGYRSISSIFRSKRWAQSIFWSDWLCASLSESHACSKHALSVDKIWNCTTSSQTGNRATEYQSVMNQATKWNYRAFDNIWGQLELDYRHVFCNFVLYFKWFLLRVDSLWRWPLSGMVRRRCFLSHDLDKAISKSKRLKGRRFHCIP